MNKMMKGSVAGATGIALLMGGFGTYALWSDSADLDATEVNSGVLTIDDNGDGAYANPSNAGDPTWGANMMMVPGDVVTYTQTFDLAGTGKNLQGTVDFATQNLDSDFEPGDFTRDIDVTITGASAAITETPSGSNNFTFADPFEAATLTVVVTYDFVDADGTDSQGAQASTPATTLTIAQTNN